MGVIDARVYRTLLPGAQTPLQDGNLGSGNFQDPHARQLSVLLRAFETARASVLPL